MAEFKPDNQIMEKPKCAVPNCKNEAWILFGGEWVCGRCVANHHFKQQKMIFENLVEANK